MDEDFLEFQWDSEKALRNLRKHRISFREAAMVFGDIRAITFYDEMHSDRERRFLTMGMSDKGRVLVVSHTVAGEQVRIISARKATRYERNLYEKESK
jgi:uncharacterized DUF497 family protein